MFRNKTLMITGGTGSFGNAVLKRVLQTELREIRILQFITLLKANGRVRNGPAFSFFAGFNP